VLEVYFLIMEIIVGGEKRISYSQFNVHTSDLFTHLRGSQLDSEIIAGVGKRRAQYFTKNLCPVVADSCVNAPLHRQSEFLHTSLRGGSV
jgi:hypothetical protein